MERFAKPGVAGIIEKSEAGVDYILIQERCKADAPAETGLLEIPAGKIREFENIYDCLRREVKEETGLAVTVIVGEDDASYVRANGYKVLMYQPFASSQNLEGEYPIMVQAFLCRVAGELLSLSDEARNMRWIKLDELSGLLADKQETFYPMHVGALRKYLAARNYR